jgi:hypothetical protein
MIETTKNNKHNMTIYKCSGVLTTQEMIDAINSLYNGQPTKYTLWDFSKASLKDIPAEGIRKIFELIKKMGTVRKGGKTAAVTPSDLGYGMARMFQIMSDTDDFPFKIEIFINYREASQWLLSQE